MSPEAAHRPPLALRHARSILEQQKVFQAQKKASGNTFTARGMPINYFAVIMILGGGMMVVCSNLNKVYYGKGKILSN